eukprot:3269703-Rhodomonas_salina.1
MSLCHYGTAGPSVKEDASKAFAIHAVVVPKADRNDEEFDSLQRQVGILKDVLVPAGGDLYMHSGKEQRLHFTAARVTSCKTNRLTNLCQTLEGGVPKHKAVLSTCSCCLAAYMCAVSSFAHSNKYLHSSWSLCSEMFRRCRAVMPVLQPESCFHRNSAFASHMRNVFSSAQWLSGKTLRRHCNTAQA